MEHEDQIRGIKQLTKSTYALGTDEKDDKIRGLKAIDQVHVRSVEG
jgi:hypothetical protein